MEIFLDIPFGAGRLIIDSENIICQGRSIRTGEVDRVRWGIQKNYVNGVRTSRNFTIWVGSPNDMIEFECAGFMERESTVVQRYQQILDKLWKAVCVRLLRETLYRLSSGEKLSFGKVVVDKDGIVLTKYKLMLLPSGLVHYPWEKITINSGGGYFKISVINEKSSNAQLSYREVDNVHILESIIRFLFKEGNYIKLRSGEFQ